MSVFVFLKRMSSNSRKQHEGFMRECCRLAERGKGFVSPNPLVGAVLVVNNAIVAQGFHKYFGGPHAEVECLRKFKGNLSDAILYVNLEPCSHYGKTPQCTDLIIQRGIKKVVVAMKDPNPLVSGKGIAKLRRAGVRVEVGVLKNEAEYFNRFFIKHITTKIPYVHLKIAQTADGFIARHKGPMHYVTSISSRRLVHQWRAEYDAVLVGAGTIKTDNPQLNVRLVKGRDPAVVVLDGRLSVTGNEKMFSSALERNIYLCATGSSVKSQQHKVTALRRKGIQVLQFASRTKRLNHRQVLRTLHKHSIGSILVEGGSHVFTEFLQNKLIDELSIFFSPKTFGRGVPVFSDNGITSRQVEKLLRNVQLVPSKVGSDLLLSGRV